MRCRRQYIQLQIKRTGPKNEPCGIQDSGKDDKESETRQVRDNNTNELGNLFNVCLTGGIIVSFLFDLLVIVPHARHNILTGPVPHYYCYKERGLCNNNTGRDVKRDRDTFQQWPLKYFPRQFLRGTVNLQHYLSLLSDFDNSN